jgi:hypothetical protein
MLAFVVLWSFLVQVVCALKGHRHDPGIGSLRHLAKLKPAKSVSLDQELSFIIRTSRVPIQIKRGTELKTSLIEEGVPSKNIVLLHELDKNEQGEFATPGFWSYIPYLVELGKRTQKTKWYVFCEPNTVVHANKLNGVLSSFDPGEKLFLGKMLKSVGGITQQEKDFPYPLAKSGFAMSAALISALSTSLATENQEKDFTIDPSFLLAKFVKARTQTAIQNNNRFCMDDKLGCATAILPAKYASGPFTVSPEDVIIAVKTTAAFHASRLPILQQTWMKDAAGVKIVYMSETADSKIPTINLIENWPHVLKKNSETATGHCAKFTAIMYGTFECLIYSSCFLQHLSVVSFFSLFYT